MKNMKRWWCERMMWNEIIWKCWSVDDTWIVEEEMIFFVNGEMKWRYDDVDGWCVDEDIIFFVNGKIIIDFMINSCDNDLKCEPLCCHYQCVAGFRPLECCAFPSGFWHPLSYLFYFCFIDGWSVKWRDDKMIIDSMF